MTQKRRDDGAPAQDGTVNSEEDFAEDKPPKPTCEVLGQWWEDATAYLEDYETIGDGAPR